MLSTEAVRMGSKIACSDEAAREPLAKNSVKNLSQSFSASLGEKASWAIGCCLDETKACDALKQVME
jgi:hypothetical protein